METKTLQHAMDAIDQGQPSLAKIYIKGYLKDLARSEKKKQPIKKLASIKSTTTNKPFSKTNVKALLKRLYKNEIDFNELVKTFNKMSREEVVFLSDEQGRLETQIKNIFLEHSTSYENYPGHYWRYMDEKQFVRAAKSFTTLISWIDKIHIVENTLSIAVNTYQVPEYVRQRVMEDYERAYQAEMAARKKEPIEWHRPDPEMFKREYINQPDPQ